MKLTFFTCSAHPAYGTVRPGQSVEVPDELAQELIEGRYAVPAGGRETARVDGGERAVLPPAKPKTRKAE